LFSPSALIQQYGLVASLARPGGNVTGVTFLGGELPPKQLEVLHETVPKCAIIGMLENPTTPAPIRNSRQRSPPPSRKK
jgi:putative ABC transport system substrate-binding protein